jgi:hypothetical protein
MINFFKINNLSQISSILALFINVWILLVFSELDGYFEPRSKPETLFVLPSNSNSLILGLICLKGFFTGERTTSCYSDIPFFKLTDSIVVYSPLFDFPYTKFFVPEGVTLTLRALDVILRLFISHYCIINVFWSLSVSYYSSYSSSFILSFFLSASLMCFNAFSLVVS